MGLYSGPGLVEAVVGRMKRGGTEAESRELWLLLAYLYEAQARCLRSGRVVRNGL